MVKSAVIPFLVIYFLIVFPVLNFGSLNSSCQKFCCHEGKSEPPAPENSGDFCCSTANHINENCPENSSSQKNSQENPTPFRCPIEICCQPTELPGHFNLPNEFQQDREPIFLLEMGANTLSRIFPSGDDGIFSLPLKPFHDNPGPRVYLRNCVLNV